MSMAWHKTAVTPLLTHLSYCSLMLSPQCDEQDFVRLEFRKSFAGIFHVATAPGLIRSTYILRTRIRSHANSHWLSRATAVSLKSFAFRHSYLKGFLSVYKPSAFRPEVKVTWHSSQRSRSLDKITNAPCKLRNRWVYISHDQLTSA